MTFLRVIGTVTLIVISAAPAYAGGGPCPPGAVCTVPVPSSLTFILTGLGGIAAVTAAGWWIRRK